MKKLLLPVLISCLLLSGCKTTPPDPSTAPSETQNIIEATRPQTREISIRTGIVDRSGSVETRTEYRLNKQDRVEEALVYTNGQLTQRYSVQCDSHGNPTLWESATSQIHYTYADGQLQSYKITHGTTVVSSTEYTHKDGLLVQISQKMPLQALELRQDMTYAAAGNLLRQDDYRNGTLQSYTVYTLDDAGKTAQAITYLADGTTQRTLTYTYKDNTVIATATDGSYEKQVYDPMGNLCLTGRYDADGTEISCQEYRWQVIQIPIDAQRISI